MTVWGDEVEDTIRQVLAEVRPAEPNREHLGRPFITAYQLALRVDAQFPGLARQLGYDIGGVGVGRYVSLTNYLASQLSQRIRRGDVDAEPYFVEGAQLAAGEMTAMTFANPNGRAIENSNLSSGDDSTMFRLRD